METNLESFISDKLVKQAQHRFRSELTVQIEAELNKLIEAGFVREVQYPIWLAGWLVLFM